MQHESCVPHNSQAEAKQNMHQSKRKVLQFAVTKQISNRWLMPKVKATATPLANHQKLNSSLFISTWNIYNPLHTKSGSLKFNI